MAPRPFAAACEAAPTTPARRLLTPRLRCLFADAAPLLPAEPAGAGQSSPTRRLPVGDSDNSVVFAQKWWNAAGLEGQGGQTLPHHRRRRGPTDNSRRRPRLLVDQFHDALRPKARGALGIQPSVSPSSPRSVERRPGTEEPLQGNFVASGVGVPPRRQVDASQLQTWRACCAEIDRRPASFLYFFANDSTLLRLQQQQRLPGCDRLPPGLAAFAGPVSSGRAG